MKVAKASPMLSVGQDLVVHHAEPIALPFDFEEARFALVVGGVLRRVLAGKPPVLSGGRLYLLVGLD